MEAKKKCDNIEMDEKGEPIEPIEPTANNEIYFMAPFWDDTVLAFCRSLDQVDPSEDITTLLNSCGGSVFSGWTAIGRMKERKGKNNGNVYGDASSMAFYFTLYCDYVKALRVTNFTVHRASGYCSSEADQKTLDNINKELRKKMESKINADKFFEITGHTIKEIFDSPEVIDVALTAKEAKQCSIVNEVIDWDKNQVKAYSERFVALASKRGSFGDYQGDNKAATTEKIKTSINQTTVKKMTKDEFKAAHPAVYAEIYAEGAASGKAGEEARVKAWMPFMEHDPAGVIKAINEGTEMNQVVMSEMTVKIATASKLGKIEKDGKSITAGASKTNEQEEKTPEQKNVEAFTAQVKSAMKDFKLS